MEDIQIALVSARPDEVVPQGWHRFNSVSGLLSSPETLDVVVLGLPESSIESGLMALRKDNRYQLALIYVSGTRDCSFVLADGLLPASQQEVRNAHAELQQRLAVFNRGRVPATLEERVMAWLWTRPQSGLVALRDTALPQIYSYPLIRVFSGSEPVNETLWLRLMSEHGWLAAEGLIDRVRLCTQCNSAHLNYVDVCPSCKNLNIARQPALHCFTCGHVAPQEQFLKDGLLLCPNCLTKLRHIGSDYDRPLENQTCRACDASFMDAEVQVRCLDCDHTQQPDALRVREVRDYHLTERGRLRCRQGFTEAVGGEHFSRLNLVSLNEFHVMLDWQIQQAHRYKGTPACSVLALRFDGLENLLDSLEGQTVLDNLVERIEQVIRDTDRCTRTRENLLWILLPHTNRRGANALFMRLSSVAQLLDVDGVKAQLKLAVLTLPEDLVEEESAQLLMGRLAGRLV